MLLAACVEAALAANDVPTARTAAEELATVAADLGAPYLRALAGRATGAVRLAEGDARAALGELRQSEAIGRSWRRPTRRPVPGCSSGASAVSSVM